MTQRDDLLGRVKELQTATEAHRATSRSIRAMIFDGDYAAATTALDALEVELHQAVGGGPGGSGLPEQWTDGGNGNVTATVDDPEKTAITIDAVTAQSAALLRINTDDDGTGYEDGIIVSGPNDEFFFTVDTAGEVVITTRDTGASGLSVLGTVGMTNNHLIQVAGASPNAPVFDVENDGRVTVGASNKALGLRIAGPTSVPADAAVSPGQVMFWFDATDGAAKLMLKGKSANGTVVTGQVALS